MHHVFDSSITQLLHAVLLISSWKTVNVLILSSSETEFRLFDSCRFRQQLNHHSTLPTVAFIFNELPE